jgi:hypothetical protein
MEAFLLSEQYLIIAAFAIIGAGLKYIDEAFDENAFNKKTAGLMALVLLVIWIGLSIFDTSSGTILLSILIGVLCAGKIDNSIFGVSTAAIFGSFMFIQRIPILPILLLSAFGLIDEKGNDYADSNDPNKFVKFFFLHRFTMKIGLFLLCLAGLFAYQYLLAFLLFDISYDTVGLISERQKELTTIKKHLLTETPLPNTA